MRHRKLSTVATASPVWSDENLIVSSNGRRPPRPVGDRTQHGGLELLPWGNGSTPTASPPQQKVEDMMGKLTLLAGAAIGYVLGAKAGHQRYEQIMGRATKAWSSDPVQFKVETAKDAVRTKTPIIAEKVSEAAKITGSKLKDKATGEDLPEPAEGGSDGKAHADVSGFGPGSSNLR
jgi:hypothetical protein